MSMRAALDLTAVNDGETSEKKGGVCIEKRGTELYDTMHNQRANQGYIIIYTNCEWLFSTFIIKSLYIPSYDLV